MMCDIESLRVQLAGAATSKSLMGTSGQRLKGVNSKSLMGISGQLQTMKEEMKE